MSNNFFQIKKNYTYNLLIFSNLQIILIFLSIVNMYNLLRNTLINNIWHDIGK
jgi:hypothetical protein